MVRVGSEFKLPVELIERIQWDNLSPERKKQLEDDAHHNAQLEKVFKTDRIISLVHKILENPDVWAACKDKSILIKTMNDKFLYLGYPLCGIHWEKDLRFFVISSKGEQVKDLEVDRRALNVKEVFQDIFDIQMDKELHDIVIDRLSKKYGYQEAARDELKTAIE